MHSSTDPASATPSPVQLLAYPFRIFFLSVALWAAIAIPLWLLALTGGPNPPLAMVSLYWHQHEILFGLLYPAIAGFLLTAVCVWTQTERTHGLPLLLMWLLWLAGRVAMAFGAEWPAWLVHGVNLAFLPVVMADAGYRIWRARQLRQVIVLAVLSLLWLMQLGFLLSPSGPFIAGGLVVTMALMMAIGGRITPAFSANWLRGTGGDPDRIVIKPWLERLTLGSLLALIPAVLLGLSTATGLLAVLAAAAGGARLWLWRGWLVRREPLLWILHLSLWWIPAALLLMAGHAFGLITATVWMHAAGAGAMAPLILGVMSRVALGHTGRSLILPAGMTAAFVLVHIAALLRVLANLTLFPWFPAVMLSATLWCLAFLIFLWRYTPILASPRADGRPG